MLSFEHVMAQKGYKSVCGIDEAGRGPLAGPVMAAAVILDPNDIIEGLNDSKKLSAKKREALFEQIITRAAAYGIGQASVEEIEAVNILNATFLAMKRAVENLQIKPDYALVDGNRDPKLGVETLCIVGGDGKSASIAAASILAKVSRDKYMTELGQEYPQYMFDVHKGYGTKAHIELIMKYGACEHHRKSFLKKIYARSN